MFFFRFHNRSTGLSGGFLFSILGFLSEVVYFLICVFLCLITDLGFFVFVRVNFLCVTGCVSF